MDNENKENQKPVTLEDKRNAFVDNLEAIHPRTPDALEADSEDSQESEVEKTSEETAGNESHSDSSSVKEEVKGREKTEALDAKADEVLKNKEKALHEEREKRKQANLRLKELQRQYDDKLKEFERKLEDAVRVKAKAEMPESEDDNVSSDDTQVKELRRKLQELENRQQDTEIRKKQDELNEKITATDKKLKEAGFPGFKWAASRVDQILRQLIDEGEYTQDEYLEPSVWEEVYRTKVYEEVASEFKVLKKQETVEKKIEQKKQAAKAAIYPGAKPTMDVDDGEEPESDDIQDYLKFKSKSSPGRNIR